VAADVLSFEAPFLIFAGLAFALLIAAWLVLPWEAPRSRPAVPALSAIMRSVGSATGAWSATISLTSAGVLGLIEVVAPLDLDARLGVSSAAIGLLFAGSIAVDAALSPVGGRWGDRRGRLGPAITGLALSALSALLLAVLPGVAGTAVALAVYGAGFSLAFAAAVPWLDEAFEETERGLAYGVQNLLYAGGYAIGPIIGGVLLELGGAELAYILTAAALAACTIALAIAPPTRRRRRAG
jgi:MFS family permease